MTDDVFPDPSGAFGARVRERLSKEIVLWLTTTGADGAPQPNPVWFLWEGGDSVLVYNRPDANRITHVRSRPRVSLNFDGNGRGGDIVVLTGNATLLEDFPPAHEYGPYVAKYAADMERVSGSAENFGRRYPVAMRIDITRVR